jgi:hypothetical protein
MKLQIGAADGLQRVCAQLSGIGKSDTHDEN